MPRPLPDRPTTLGAWADALPGARLVGAARATAAPGLVDDSRHVAPGDLFVARAGAEADGRAFAAEALARGAAAVLAEVPLPDGGPTLVVGDVAAALVAAADLRFGRPQDDLALVGITGTKGKTTTARLAAAALEAAGRRAAVLGTIAHDVGDGAPRPATNTTPGVLALRRLLADARAAGCDAAVLEVSSHALDQGRVAGLDFAAGVFTNLGRDHLDYHEDEAAYLDAKARLFRDLAPGATALLNRDDPRWRDLAAATRGRVVTYGRDAAADLRAEAVRVGAEASRFRLRAADMAFEVETPLVGRHNVANLLAAIGAAHALGVDLAVAARGASGVAGVRGRLERVAGAEDLHVFVDYAHTDEALQQVLGFLREIGTAHLTCVVGCGGDRDRSKRPRMARTAAALADRVLLTSDNPRTEDPEAILHDMQAGLDEAGAARTTTLPDRREAIRQAVREAPPGGTVLVAGKGHEDYQIVGTTRHPFDDVEEVRAALVLRARAPEASQAGMPSRT